MKNIDNNKQQKSPVKESKFEYIINTKNLPPIDPPKKPTKKQR